MLICPTSLVEQHVWKSVGFEERFCLEEAVSSGSQVDLTFDRHSGWRRVPIIGCREVCRGEDDLVGGVVVPVTLWRGQGEVSGLTSFEIGTIDGLMYLNRGGGHVAFLSRKRSQLNFFCKFYILKLAVCLEILVKIDIGKLNTWFISFHIETIHSDVWDRVNFCKVMFKNFHKKLETREILLDYSRQLLSQLFWPYLIIIIIPVLTSGQTFISGRRTLLIVLVLIQCLRRGSNFVLRDVWLWLDCIIRWGWCWPRRDASDSGGGIGIVFA